jgi:pyruvate/2-oxoglutarate/acetoin dehydrogenase E1 component
VEEEPVSPDEPTLLRGGDDLLIISYSLMAQRAREAAESVQERGVSAAVLSVPLLHPMPVAAILEVAEGYDRLLFVDESRAAGSPMSLVMARLFERGSRARCRLVCTRDAPAPFAAHLLDEVVPTVARIADAIVAL